MNITAQSIRKNHTLLNLDKDNRTAHYLKAFHPEKGVLKFKLGIFFGYVNFKHPEIAQQSGDSVYCIQISRMTHEKYVEKLVSSVQVQLLIAADCRWRSTNIPRLSFQLVRV